MITIEGPKYRIPLPKLLVIFLNTKFKTSHLNSIYFFQFLKILRAHFELLFYEKKQANAYAQYYSEIADHLSLYPFFFLRKKMELPGRSI